ncbi:DUF4430 domain-containing protein [Candidatus Galacturonibacter soehngenii]|uniref:DUF4430 domain-containing protein n=2 Tax=Candidatus Galacturonatibacter soehngenii TaxID=2307010 RepID=A0A7V7QMR4_9FIRM|nr:DUF4430 domain-containing protein [Candidatus Galacturonibacter soehngenii]
MKIRPKREENNMTKYIKSILPIMLLILNLFAITACSNVRSDTEKPSETLPSKSVEQDTKKTLDEQKNDEIEITLSIYNMENEAIYSENIKTETKNLLEVMSNIEELKLVTEDSEGGKFIVSIMDISYDYGQYWECYINGEELLENISLYEIKNNDVIEFRYEKS